MLSNAWWTILAILIGLFGGFALANLVFRSEITQSNSLPITMRTSESTEVPSENQSNDRLTPEELTSALAQADAQPQNYALNREIGLALFRYSILENKLTLTEEAWRILTRLSANKIQNDEAVLTACADASFILGREKDSAKIKSAQDYYRQILNFKKDDADVLVKIGSTYFHSEPSEPDSAIDFYNQALKVNPKHELAMLSLASALVYTGKREKVDEVMTRLRSSIPDDSALTDLNAQVAALNVR